MYYFELRPPQPDTITILIRVSNNITVTRVSVTVKISLIKISMWKGGHIDYEICSRPNAFKIGKVTNCHIRNKCGIHIQE